ncbi:MAG TPA: hypothetical protein VM123_16400 [archaeon]|nr:hypothetical protein [archaeon]
MAEYPHILARNYLEQATVSLSDDSGNPLAEDPVYRLAYMADRSRLSKWYENDYASGIRVTFAFPESVAADTWVLDRNFNITGPSAAVQLQSSADGNSYATVDTIPGPLDSDSIYWRTFPAQTKAYWRIRLTGLTRPVSIFNLWLGKRIELGFGPYGDFDPYEEEIVGEPVHGASGGFQWTQRFRRRVLRAAFQNLTDSQYSSLEDWWTQAGREGKNWWWLTYPSSEAADPLYLNCEGTARRFAFSQTVRYGTIEAWEVK